MESIKIEIENNIKLYRRCLITIFESLERIQKIIYQYCATIDDINARIQAETALYKFALHRLHIEVCKHERFN